MPVPDSMAPELATLASAAPGDAENWIYEIKWDGYRMLARIAGSDVRLISRNGRDWTAKLQPLRTELTAMELPDGWYDGEIIVRDENGRSDFGRLQNSFDCGKTDQIDYCLFDVPFLNGRDLRQEPLEVRRDALQQLLASRQSDKVAFSSALDAPPQDMLHAACQMGLEGLIGKRRGSAYVSRRSADWIKLKCGKRQEFVIGGYTDPGGSRVGFGALLLGTHDSAGRLQYAGSVGTGFDTKALRDIYKRMQQLGADTSPFAPSKELPKGAHWLRPELVAEVAFAEWTHAGSVRHATFRGLRADKPAVAIRREVATPPPRAPGPPAPIKVTNATRIIDTSTGITKGQLVDYYANVGPLMAEHLRDRPVSLVRAPQGVGGELFFQKHADGVKLAGVRRFPASIHPGHPPMLEVSSMEAVLTTAQWNVIEYHTQNAVGIDYMHPDRVIFDLDPGDGVTWDEIGEAALMVRAVLEHLGLRPFLKTSGGKGLHLVVPIHPAYTWDQVKQFSKAVVVHIAATLPDRFSAKSGAGNRKRKIFIDYLRNGRGATTACAWSARARPGMGVSVPVSWDELQSLTGGDHWNVFTALARLDTGNSPWDAYADGGESLNEAFDTLELTPRRR